jgi:hypothetical protein
VISSKLRRTAERAYEDATADQGIPQAFGERRKCAHKCELLDQPGYGGRLCATEQAQERGESTGGIPLWANQSHLPPPAINTHSGPVFVQINLTMIFKSALHSHLIQTSCLPPRCRRSHNDSSGGKILSRVLRVCVVFLPHSRGGVGPSSLF